MSQRRTKIYTVEFKESSADLAMTSDQSVAQVARIVDPKNWTVE